MHLNMSSAKQRPFRPRGDELKYNLNFQLYLSVGERAVSHVIPVCDDAIRYDARRNFRHNFPLARVLEQAVKDVRWENTLPKMTSWHRSSRSAFPALWESSGNRYQKVKWSFDVIIVIVHLDVCCLTASRVAVDSRQHDTPVASLWWYFRVF